MGDFTFNHVAQQDDLYKSMSAEQIKQAFDSRGNELKTVVNNLIDALQATTGAGNIGATTIEGLTGTTVQSLIESLKTLVDGKAKSTDVYTKLALLSTTAGSSGADLIKSSPISGVKGSTIREILQDLKYQINAAVVGTIPNGSITKEKLAFSIATDDTQITVTDANNHFTATKLDGVLDELFTSADNMQKNVSNAIGSPATGSDTSEQLAGHITTEKGRIASNVGDGASTDSLKYLVDRLEIRTDELAANINVKGVPATSADTLAQLSTKVSQIPTGKKWASGYVTSGGNMYFQYASSTSTMGLPHVIVTGLTFKPSFIILNAENGNARYRTIYEEIDSHYPKTAKVFAVDGDNLAVTNYNFKADVSNAIVTETGFTLPVSQPSLNYTWVAYE